jgi:Ca-activated chloride channel family protein
MDILGIHLHSPEFLLFWLLIPLVLYNYRRENKHPSSSVRFSTLKIIKEIKPGSAVRWYPLLRILRISALFLLVIALARPQKGDTLEEVQTEGVDIMLALDMSGSMDMLDMMSNAEKRKLRRQNARSVYESGSYKEHSRLAYAHKVIHNFIVNRKHDRIGLTIFGSRAFVQAPLSVDYELVNRLLNDAVKSPLSERGTAIGDALMIAAKRLADSNAKSRIIILLTDGSNTDGEVPPLKAAEIAKAAGIKIYTIGIGKTKGNFLHFAQDFFRGIVWDEAPVDQQSSIDVKTLEEIAAQTGGRFFKAENEDELNSVYETIDELETSEIHSWKYTRYQEQFYPFLLIGLFLFLVERLLAATWLRRIP